MSGGMLTAVAEPNRRTLANRANGTSSRGGPRSAVGKSRSRWNALRHGLCARAVVIEHGEGREDASEYRRILLRFWEGLAPVGVVEETLVETIAASYWRRARLLRAETGAIRAQLDTLTLTGVQDDWVRAEELAEDPDSPAERMRDLPGVDSLLNAVAVAREQWDAQGSLTEDEFDAFAEVVGNRHELLAPPSGKLGKGAEARRHEEGRALLDQLEVELNGHRALLVEKEALTLEHERMRRAIPDEPTASRLMRYEAHLDRQVYKALHELERRQALRYGQPVAPRIHVDVEVAGREE